MKKLFYDAVRAEASGDLVKAVEIYCEIAETEHSANLHANLGKPLFQIGGLCPGNSSLAKSNLA